MNEKAIAIAQDVIAQLDAKFIQAERGIYLCVDTKDAIPRWKLQSEDNNVQKHILNGNITHCECCAIGAMIIAKARLYDAVGFENLGSGFSIRDNLRDIVSEYQLRLIEDAFENFGYYPENVGFVKKYADFPTEMRLRLIMENIVANDGEFVPYRSLEPTLGE